ncbi:tyrosine-type recombinase/integrase [Treponema bryantii]|uniref:tyrosine-type recombinase/integrase n=1 Tax=Treponema bryantii TaxID=163 RepID=UPI0003B3516F|nr:tyrosine-type recombinase/integrase [Treponema bryantii]
MDSNYHLFKKSIQSKGKTVHKWYYYWNDPFTGVMRQKVCKGCKTQAEAYAFVSALPPLFAEKKITIKDITKYMFVPGSEHVERNKKLGKKWDKATLRNKRFYLNLIDQQFGDMELKDLTIPMVTEFLINYNRSGSWKNNFITAIRDIYDEAPFMGLPYIPKLDFPSFIRDSKKKDIFTTEELNILFDESLWINLSNDKYRNHPQFDEGHRSIYLMLLCCANFGLRISEGIGIKANQFLFDQKMFVVDGFYKNDERIRTNFNKKGSEEDRKIRVVPIPDNIHDIMKKYIQENNSGPDDYVFLRYGHPIRRWLAEKWFKQALEFSGINVGTRRLSPHSLRYTYITRMRRDVAGETVQKIAGHTSLAMTDHYTRAAIPEMVEAVKPAAEAANRLFE